MPRTNGTTTARGYGHLHQKQRKQYLARLRDGDLCAECQRLGKRHPMYRSHAHLLDLSHNTTRTQVIGLSWRACNRREGAIRGNKARGTTLLRRTPHAW